MSPRWLLVLLLGVLLTLSTVHADDPTEDEMEDEEDDVELDEAPAAEETPAQPPITRPEYRVPKAKGKAYLAEPFDSQDKFAKRWVQSTAKKEDTDEEIAKYDGKWSLEEPKDNPLTGDLGLTLKSKAKHHAISAKLDQTFDFSGDPLVVQYEVKFQNGQDCGGAYIKLLSKDNKSSLKNFYDKTPYTIMFGPDKCGNDNKLHFIFRHKNPKTGKFEEKHAKKPDKPIDVLFTDKKTHLFTLIVHPDNQYEILVDQDLVNSGSLLEDFDPPVNPPKEIVDPEDKKPEDWDEREKIPDPDAVKPEDWDESQPEMIEDESATKPSGWLDDEPELILDPDSSKPDDWDEDMDGEWEAPQINNPKCDSAPGCGKWTPPKIKNPKYQGKWKPPMIENPNYKGKWKPRKIPNPDFFEDNEPYKMTPIDAIGLELWSMSDDIVFDNFLITGDKSVADAWAEDTWELKRTQELAGSSGKSVVQAVMDATNERPWLWAVFLIVVVLPLFLLIGYCCSSPRKVPDDIARAKKTDEPSPDDQPDEDEGQQAEAEGEEAQDETDEATAGDAKPAGKKSKADLEAEDKDAQANEGDAENEEEEEEEDKEEEESVEDKAARRTSPRRRQRRE